MKITDIITPVSTKYGAPMGRANVGIEMTYTSGPNCKVFKKNQPKIYDKRVPMSNCGVYDIGGAYWGCGKKQLRVRFTKDLSFIQYYRAL